MGWNRPSEEKKVEVEGKGRQWNGRLKGLIAGAIVVVGAAVAAWWLWPEGRTRQDAASTTRGLIRKVRPTVISALSVESGESGGLKVQPESFRVSTNSPIRHMPLIRQNDGTNHIYRIRPSAGKTVYRNEVEQMMVSIFTCPLGATPLPVGRISKENRAKIMEILSNTNEYQDDDSEHDRICRNTIAEAKVELARYIDRGGDVNSFFKFYHDELLNAYYLRKDAEEEVTRILEDENDPSLAREFLKRVNKNLEDKGILGVRVRIENETEGGE